MNTKPLNLPVAISARDRGLLESVAQIKGLALSTWVRVAAIERSRAELAALHESEADS